ncbi:Sma protein, partial [Toxoplasma gondii GAB2-2007-GAL-DOM2]
HHERRTGRTCLGHDAPCRWLGDDVGSDDEEEIQSAFQ